MAVQVRVAFLGAAVEGGGRGAGRLVNGQDGFAVWGCAGFMTVMVGVIMEVRGSQIFDHRAILHYGFSRHTFKRT